MVADELTYLIIETLGMEPTAEQRNAIGVFCRFLADLNPLAVMILRGCAGTGKTTLAAAMVQTLARLKQRVTLLAPTGRAAKVFSLNSGLAAYTIHRRIYCQRTAGDMSTFNLGYNNSPDTLFSLTRHPWWPTPDSPTASSARAGCSTTS